MVLENPGHGEPFELPPLRPYDVTCARCGLVLSCDDAIPEEGDEWECRPCWERCEAQERAAEPIPEVDMPCRMEGDGR